ncbi:hypothetical protein EON65_32360 [archaeon]|nr:MAG: hypothetical protein EON65_32360 [archaeon]
MESALELANSRDGNYGAQKQDFMTQIDKLKTQVEQMHTTVSTLQEENNNLKANNAELDSKFTTAEDWQLRYNTLEKEFKDFCASMENLKHEAEMMRSERDSLAAIVKQKDSLLWLQGQQSEMSIKMLQQRQAALDRSDTHVISTEEWKRLTESLRDLFTQEGQVLHSELLDTKKLTQMIRDLREKMSLYDSLQQQVEGERLARKELENRLASCLLSMRDQEKQRDDLARLASSLQQELQECSKLGYVRRTLPSGLFISPSHFFGSSNNDSSQHKQMLLEQQCEQYKVENNMLKSQLDLAQREANNARDDVQKAQQAAQKDLSSLWSAVQELNKLDAMKDKSIQDLVMERARLSAERDAALNETKLAREQCEELRRELDVSLS